MFDSSLTTPLHFTVEFFGFLVMGGAALMAFTRPELLTGSASNRVAMSVGFGALAAAQVLHGGAFIDIDGDEFLLGLEAFGLAAVLIGVSGAMRSGTVVGAAFTIREGIALVPAGAALLLALVATISSSRGEARSLRRLGLGALLLAVSSGLVAVVPGARFGVGEVEPYAVASHAAKFLGYIAIAAWLWSGVRSSIRTRFVAAFAALLVAVVLALSTALTGVISNNVEAEELKRVGTQLRSAIQEIENTTQRDLKSEAQQIAELDDVRASLARRADLTRFALGLADAPELFDEIDFIMFLDEKKTITGLAGHGPRIERRGRFRRVPLRQADVISLAGSPVVDEALEQGVAATLAKVRDKAPILAAARVRHPRFAARTVGVVLVAHYVDARTVDRISANFDPASGSLIVDGRLVASGLRGDLTVRALLPGRVRPRLLAGETVTLEQTIGRGSFFSAISLLSNARGSPIEDVALLLSSPGEIVTQTRESVVQTLFLVALSAGLIALLLAWFSGRRIAQPIQMLTRTAQKVREGDLSARTNVAGEDEVGQLGETFNEMTSSLSRMTDDLREAAREEHRLRARIETIIQSMADALVAVDPQRKVLAFNREAEKLTGIKAKKAVGQPIDDVLDVRDAQGEPVTLPIQRLTEGSVGGVFIFRRGRDPIPVAVTSAVLRGEGDEPTGGVAVIRDMSREHELERMKTEFLANISHELRTPLTPIKGYAEILGRRDVSPEKTRQFVGGILESTGRLERIVGLLLDFSAMEAGKLSPRTAPVDIGAMLEEMASEWAHRAPRHEVVAEVATPLPKVIGDERLLRRSLEELLDNAVKFSPQGGKIRLQAKSASGNGRRNGAVEVTVEDQGIGISPEDLPKIFYDFHQLDGSETRTYGGLGLGLAFVQRIVKAHDGSVSVESRPEQGTRLTITIPAATRTGGED